MFDSRSRGVVTTKDRAKEVAQSFALSLLQRIDQAVLKRVLAQGGDTSVLLIIGSLQQIIDIDVNSFQSRPRLFDGLGFRQAQTHEPVVEFLDVAESGFSTIGELRLQSLLPSLVRLLIPILFLRMAGEGAPRVFARFGLYATPT